MMSLTLVLLRDSQPPRFLLHVRTMKLRGEDIHFVAIRKSASEYNLEKALNYILASLKLDWLDFVCFDQFSFTKI